MRQKYGRLMVLFIGATVALATLGVGYGLWFGQLTITGQVETGSVVLAFVDTPGTPYVTPYTNDDNVVNDPANDPFDTGICVAPFFDDDGDTLIDEDPIDGVDNDGDTLIDEDPPGKLSTCDPRSTAVWTASPYDEDSDGLLDEDPADGIDNDGDGLVDEDGVGGWVLPFLPALNGQDIGKAVALIEDAGKTLAVYMTNPSVAAGNVVYNPTVWAKIINNGTIPVVVVDIRLTVTPAYELWDRDADNILTDNGVVGACDLSLGDECAAPLVAELNGLAVGDILNPGVPVPVTLDVSMTPAAVAGAAYNLALTITGNNFNEPGP